MTPQAQGTAIGPSPLRRALYWLSKVFAFFWEAFVTSFCLRPPLLAVLLLILALLLGQVGEGYGISQLVFHDDPPKQLWAGVSLGLLTIGTLLIGFLLWNADLFRRAEQERKAKAAEGAPQAAAPEAVDEVAPPADPLPARPTRRWPLYLLLALGLVMVASNIGVVLAGKGHYDATTNESAPDKALGWFYLGVLGAAAVGLLLLRWAQESGTAGAGGGGEGVRAPGWPFFGYAVGILVSFLAVMGVLLLLLEGVKAISRMHGYGHPGVLPQLAEGADLDAGAEPDKADVYWLPLVAGAIDSALLTWVLFWVAFSGWVDRPLRLGWRRLKQRQQALAGEGPPAEASFWRKAARLVGFGRQEAGGGQDEPGEWTATKYHLFVTALVVLSAAWYPGVIAWLASWLGTTRRGWLEDVPLASRWWSWWLALLAGGLGLAAVLVVARAAFPRYWRMLVREVADNTQMPAKRDYRYHAAAILIVLFMVVYYAVLSSIPPWNSPVTAGCFFLFVLVAAYGLLAYTVHRAVPILLAGLILLFVFAGVPPLKFRFDGLPGDKVKDSFPDGARILTRLSPEDVKALKEEFPHLALEDGGDELAEEFLDLTKHAVIDADRQRRFDAELSKLVELKRQEKEGRPGAKEELAEAEAKLKKLKHEFRFNRVRPIIDPRRAVVMEKTPADPSQPPCPEDPRLLTPADLGLRPSREGADDREPLVVVAVSGGGLRAAVWALRVLQELEMKCAEENIDFPSRVRLIGGASGGMLGAAYYVATLPGWEERQRCVGGGKGPHEGRLRRRAQMKFHSEQLRKDFLTPILQRGVLNDLPSFFSPYPNLRDRGKALEEAWREHLLTKPKDEGGVPALDGTFADLRDREAEGDLPSLVFSPMMVEDGRRLLVSNLDLRYVAANTGNRVGKEIKEGEGHRELYSLEALELFRLFPEAKDKFKLSTAVRMSATFPYFTPAVSLPTSPRRRVVDAGYYDNFGVSLASSWLLSPRNAGWIEGRASKIVLIQIRASVSEEQRSLRRVPAEAPGVFGSALDELSSPPEGLFNSVFASASFRNDGQLELLSAYFRHNRLRQANEAFDRKLRPWLKKEYAPAEVRQDLHKLLTERLRPGVADRPGHFLAAAKDYLRPRLQKEEDEPKVLDDTMTWLQNYLLGTADTAGTAHKHRYFTTVTFECGGKAALSWYLSRADRRRIDGAVAPVKGKERLSDSTDVQGNIVKLIEWWNASVSD